MAARRPRTPHTHQSAAPSPATDGQTVADPVTSSFVELGVPAALARALARNGIAEPFPIQTKTLPDTLAGRDVLGRGRTGSGKTYAFVLPVLARLAAGGAARRPGRPRALILAPTRELATQIETAIAPLARELSLRVLAIFGGVGASPQIAGLRAGVDILVACPGRLTDHVQSGHARLDAVEITVLDEADHMADLGFLPVVRRLLDLTPATGQRLLFSATLDAGVDVLVRRYLTDPVTHSVDSSLSPVTTMEHHLLHVRHDDRFPVLVDLTAAAGRKLVFTRTKRGAKTLARKLVSAGVPAVELHGNLAQNARNRNLLAFSEGSASTLVATDIAARGIHVDDVTMVIHADPPVDHKAYLHRSGRTARAGAGGTVVTLMTDDNVREVRDLARRAGIRPTTSRPQPGHPVLTELAPGPRTFVPPPAERAADADPARSGRPGRRQTARSGSGGGRGSSSSRAGSPQSSGGDSAAGRRSGNGRGRRGDGAAAPARPTGAASFSSQSRVGGRRSR